MSIRQFIVVGTIGACIASNGAVAIAQTSAVQGTQPKGTQANGSQANVSQPNGSQPNVAHGASVPDKSDATKRPVGAERKLPIRSPAPAETGSGDPEIATWSPQEVAEAKVLCAQVLRSVDAVVETTEPIKQGQCGAPAVVKLMRIGKSPEIVLNPPAVVTCEMVGALHKWFKADVQPAARAHLGGSIVKIETMSSYSCRNAYGRARTKLSEHGRANALDIGGFVTASADVTRVLASWGATARELRGIAAKSDAAVAGLPKAPGPSLATRKTVPVNPVIAGGSSGVTRSGVITGSTGTTSPTIATTTGSNGVYGVGSMSSTSVPGIIVRGPLPDIGSLESLGFMPANRLGGAKPAANEPATGGTTPDAQGKQPSGPRPVTEAHRTQFLHEVHAAACKYFGTVLGPEANNDHNNHFHVDMAPRKTGNFCE